MRILIAAALCLSPAVATSVLAQVQQNNPNGANQSMERNGQMRALQQDQTTQTDMLRMDIQRNQAAEPGANTGPNAIGPVGRTGVIGR